MFRGALLGVLLACTLLTSCATSSQQQSMDNADCARDFSPHSLVCDSGGFCLALDLIALSALGICDGTAYLMNLTRNAASNIHDGIYRPDDGRFSVMVPGTGVVGASYAVQQLRRGDDEYVFFVPSGPAEPTYSAGVRVNLPEPDASESMDEYAGFAAIDSHAEPLTDSMDFRPVRTPLQVRLDGQPALLQVYTGFDENSVPEYHLLVYVSKDSHRAEFLSIISKGSCPRCASGTEVEILADVPGASDYLASFHLADGGTKP